MALVGGEWSASCLGRFTPGESPRYPLNRRLGGRQSRSGWHAENSWTYRDWNSDHSAVQPVASFYTDWAIPAHRILFLTQIAYRICSRSLAIWWWDVLHEFFLASADKFHLLLLLPSGLPIIRKMPPISAVAGEPLAVTCPAAGFPIHAVTWEKGNNVWFTSQ
jgi:hypothetical protein